MAIRNIDSPMTGRVIEVLVSQGEHVGQGDVLVVIESMKMENEIFSEFAGAVANILVSEEQTVSEGDALVEIDTNE